MKPQNTHAWQRLNLSWGNRLPVILQTEAAECGLTCLAMINAYHGDHTDMDTLRQRFGMGLRGAALKSLLAVAQQLKLAARPVKLGLDHLSDLKLPCLLHWDMNHFVVLKRVTDSHAVIHDPAIGERRLTLDEFSQHFTGVAVEFSPTPEFERHAAPKAVSLRALMGSVSGLKRSMAQIFALAVALEVFVLVGPFFTQWVMDMALVSADRDLLTILAFGFAMIALLQSGIAIARSYMVLYLSTHVNLQWIANVFSHMMRLPVNYFEKRHLGDVVSRFRSVEVIQRTLTTSFLEALVDGLMTLAMVTIMAYYSPMLCGIVVGAAALYGLLRWMSHGPLRHATQEQILLQAKEQSLLLESIRGVQAIKLFGHEEQRRSRWLNALVDATNRSLTNQKLQLGLQGAQQLLAALENVLVIWLGASLVLDGQFTAGMLMAFVSYKTTFAQRVRALIDKAAELSMLRVQGERLADIVWSEPEAQSHGAMEPADATLSLHDVWFRYSESDPWILQGVSLTIKAGESVAITGGSGSGKTTLLKIMLGLLQPQKGEVRLGGLPLASIGPERYRELIGAVLQEDQLLCGSLTENISFFDPNADLQRAVACAHMAAIHQDIAAMPMNYSTLVGDMGSSLSGGQKQRVLLARALYKSPKLLFLDEATSHLDSAREDHINTAIRQLSMTRILIAHRANTIASADRAIHLQGGQVISDVRQPQNTPPISFAHLNRETRIA